MLGWTAGTFHANFFLIIIHGGTLRLSHKDQFREYEETMMCSMYGRNEEHALVKNAERQKNTWKN